MIYKLIERLINKDYLTERERKEWLGAIKKHLETLEEDKESLGKVIQRSAAEFNYVVNKCGKIQQENEQLKQDLQDEMKNYQEMGRLWHESETEKEKLEKALEMACERLSWDCPVSQNLIDDLDCENCCDDYEKCWKKYLLKEVLGNE